MILSRTTIGGRAARLLDLTLLALLASGAHGLGQEEQALLDEIPRHAAADVGDAYFPGVGNGGYDVEHYDLRLDVDVAQNRIDAEAVITLRATANLIRFNLDLVGLEVESVEVAGQEASFERDGRELIITPELVLCTDQSYQVSVRYGGTPEVAPDASVATMGLPGTGWMSTDSGIYVVSECVGAASWLPCNDHPSDKATFSYRITVPEPYVVAANGLLIEEIEGEGSRTFVWKASDPMATYLATINIAEFEVFVSEGPGGLPIRYYFPVDATEEERAPFDSTVPMLEHFIELFGPYPFESFGGVISYESIGGALETQTLPVYSRRAGEPVLAHELAHQWFGNCVTPTRWEDMWLNEGFATYAEVLWKERNRGEKATERWFGGVHGFAHKASIGAPVDPGVEEVFSPRTYVRGALVLHALRVEIGDELFFELLQSWVQRYFNGNATTADFIALAEELSERELDALFDSWLWAEKVPDLPANGR